MVHALVQLLAVANVFVLSLVGFSSLQTDTISHLSSPDLVQESRLSNSSLNEMDGNGDTVPELGEIAISHQH